MLITVYVTTAISTSANGQLLPGALTTLQILVEGLPADPKLAGDLGFARTGRDSRAKLCHRIRRQGFLASSIRAPLFCQGDAFLLALIDEGPLELGKGGV